MKKFNEFAIQKNRSRDEEYMEMALQQAEKAKLDGDLPVGATLVVSNQKIFDCDTVYAEGDQTNHAVMNVIKKAQMLNRNLHDSVLYTTLEPCLMCASAAHFSGIKEIVFGAYDKKNGFISSGLLHDHTMFNISYKGGVLAQKCIEIMPKEIRSYLSY